LKTRGFTLIELMIVIAIIAILAVFLFSVAGNTYGGATAPRFAEQLASTMNFARTRALSTRKIHRVEVHPDTKEIDIYAAPTEGMAHSNYDGGGVTVQGVLRVPVPSHVTIYAGVQGAMGSGSASVTQSTIEYDVDFYPDGSSRPSDHSASSSTIYITDDTGNAQDKYRVLVYHTTGSAYARQYW
jgi:prepilin-type N-terminal cleavage/methylation domain-containing protein